MEQKRLHRNSLPLSPHPKVPSPAPASIWAVTSSWNLHRSQGFQGRDSAIWVKNRYTEKVGKEAQSLAPPCSPGHLAWEEGEVGTRSLWTPTKANLCGPAGIQAQCTVPVPPVAPEASSFPCSRLPRHLSGSRSQVASPTPGSGGRFPRTWALSAHGCLPTPEAPGDLLGPPTTSSTQTLANCCHSRLSLRVLRQQGPRTVSLTLDPGGLPPIQAHSLQCPLAPVAPGGFPGLELLLSHRVLQLQQTKACSSGHQRLQKAFPAPGSREEVLRELRLSSPGHQRAPGLGESQGAGWLPSA